MKEEMHLNIDILENKNRSQKYIEGLKCVKSVAKCIKSSLVKNIDISDFYNNAKEYVDTVFINGLINSVKLNPVMFDLKENLIKMAISCYEKELETFDFSKKQEFKVGKETEMVDSYELYYKELYLMIHNCKKELGLLAKSKKKGEKE